MVSLMSWNSLWVEIGSSWPWLLVLIQLVVHIHAFGASARQMSDMMQIENVLYQIPLKEHGPHTRTLPCHRYHVHGSSIMFLAYPYSQLSHWITRD